MRASAKASFWERPILPAIRSSPACCWLAQLLIAQTRITSSICVKMYDQYTWVFGLSVIVAFAAAFGIGANDVVSGFPCLLCKTWAKKWGQMWV